MRCCKFPVSPLLYKPIKYVFDVKVSFRHDAFPNI